MAAVQKMDTITLTAADNSVQNDGAREVTVTLGLSPDIPYTLGTPSTVTVTVRDDDTPPLAPENLRAQAGNTEATLRWDPPAASTPDHGQPVLHYEYRVKVGTGSFGSWQTLPNSDGSTTSHVFTGLTNNTEYTYEVRAENVAGDGAEAQVMVTPVVGVAVSFGAATASITEGGSSAVTLTLAEAPAAGTTVTAPITATPGAGLDATEYAGVPASVTFNAGETSKSFTVTTVDNTDDEPHRVLTLGLGTLPEGYVPGTHHEFVLTLLDDDAPVVSATFDRASASVPEGAQVEVTVRLSQAPEREVALALTAARGANLEADEFSGVPAAVTFAAAATEAVFTVTFGDDAAVEGNETLTLGFQTPLPGRVTTGANPQLVLTVLDDDGPPQAPAGLAVITGHGYAELSWEPVVNDSPVLRYEVRWRETDGGTFNAWQSVGLKTSHRVEGLTNGVAYIFEVQAVNAHGSANVVSVSGTPTVFKHQVRILRTLVANTAGGNNPGEPITRHNIPRRAQAFTTGPAGAGYVLGSIGVSFRQIASRSTAGAELKVTLNEQDSNGDPGAALCTLNDPAAFDDYALNTFTAPTTGDAICPLLQGSTTYFVVVQRSSGQSNIQLTLTSRDAEDSQADRTRWSIANESLRYSGTPKNWQTRSGVFKLHVRGDYVPSLTAIDANADESGDPDSSTTMTFQISLDQKVKHAVSVDYATQDGTARAGVNYKQTSGTVTFAPREQVKTVDVEILEDDRGGSTYFKLLLSNPIGAGLRGNSPGTGRIFDTSPRFRSWDATGRENNNGTDSTMSFVVEFDHRPAGDTADYTVDYRTEAVTATAGSDYESVSGTLTWAPGDGDKLVTVTIKDDDIQDNGETFRLVLSNPSNGAQLHRTAATAIGTILNHDSEGLAATFPASAYASKSHKGPTDRPQVVVAFNSAVASISKTTPSVQVNGASITSVQAHTEDGLQNAQIFILEPDGNDDITFTLVANVACASGGICSGTGTPITQVPSSHTIPAKRTATASQLSVADAAASEEDDSTIDFVVTLSPASDESVTVDYATANGSASTGGDYTAASGSLTFNAGETSKTIQVSIIDDTVVDDNETLTVTLSNASGAEISDGQATGTITDGDTATSPLTAEFQDLPDSHDGSTAFTFRVLFSEDVGISYVNMRDDAFSLSEGDVTGARRVDGRNDLWEITVEPDDNSDVGITLPANQSCTTTGAICTSITVALTFDRIGP